MLWDFNLQQDHKIQASGENSIMLKKRKPFCYIVDIQGSPR